MWIEVGPWPFDWLVGRAYGEVDDELIGRDALRFSPGGGFNALRLIGIDPNLLHRKRRGHGVVWLLSLTGLVTSFCAR